VLCLAGPDSRTLWCAPGFKSGLIRSTTILLGAKLEAILAAATDNIAHLTFLRVSWRELIILAPASITMSLWTSRKDRLIMTGGIDQTQEGFREPPMHLHRLSCLRNLFEGRRTHVHSMER
jgi:hypothetical protein